MTDEPVGDIFSPKQTKMLSDNLDPRNVKTLQSGSRASYIEAWHAIAEANRIFGHGGWDREMVRCEETNRELLDVMQKNARVKQWRVGYIYTIRISVHGADGQIRRREGTGFGSGFSRLEALGEAIESAIKEAESDAMKRALMTFGNPFGLALYDKKKAHVGASIFGDDDEDEDVGSADAGQREPPQGKQAGAVSRDAAPVQTMKKSDAREDYGMMVEEMRRITATHELKAWGKMNAERVKLQPKDWQAEIRKSYQELMEGLAHQELAAAEANEEFSNER